MYGLYTVLISSNKFLHINRMTDPEKDDLKDDSAEDLYKDLPVFQFDEQLIKLEKDSQEYKLEATLLSTKVKELTEENSRLQKDLNICKYNYSSLLQTGKEEVKRKDNMINELRRELDSLQFRRNKKTMDKCAIKMKDQCTNTDIIERDIKKSTKDQFTNTEVVEIQNDPNGVKKTFEGRLRERHVSNGRNSISSVSSGSKLSEYGEERLHNHSKETAKDCVGGKREFNYKKRSKSRERDDTRRGKRFDRGRDNEPFRRRAPRNENHRSRSRYDKHQEDHRRRERHSVRDDSKSRRRHKSSHRSDYHSKELRRHSSDRKPGRRSSSYDRRRSDDRRNLEGFERESDRLHETTDRSRDSTKDKKHKENIIEYPSSSLEKNDTKKLREENRTVETEKPKTGDSSVKKDFALETKKFSEEKKASGEIIARENKYSVIDIKEAKKESTLKDKTKISVNEYWTRKDRSSEKNSKKSLLSAQSVLTELVNDMEYSESGKARSEGKKDRARKAASKSDFDYSSDEGHDKALLLKNGRSNAAKQETIHSRQERKMSLGVATSAQENVTEIPFDKNHLKEEASFKYHLKEKENVENRIKLEIPEKNDIVVTPDQPKNVCKSDEVKEPGEISSDENEECTKEESTEKEVRVEIVSNRLNNSSDLKEKQGTEVIAADSSSGMDTVLELPKTPDIRESQNSSLFNDETANLNKSDEKILGDLVKENNLHSSLEPVSEIAGDQTFQELAEKLCDKHELSNSLEEFSPLKKNYKLIELSPVKPADNAEKWKINRKSTEIISNITSPPDLERAKILTFCDQEDSVNLHQNSNSNNLLNDSFESSTDLTAQTSKELDSDEKKTEDNSLETSASLAINKNDFVLEIINDAKTKSNKKRTSSYSKRPSSKRKNFKKSDKNVVKEEDKRDPVLEKNCARNQEIINLNQINEISTDVEKLNTETVSSQKKDYSRKKKSLNEVPEICTRTLRARKSKSKEPSEEKIIVKEDSLTKKSTPSRNYKRKREESEEKPKNKQKESNKRKKVDDKNGETIRKSNKKSEKTYNASIFSPLPVKNNPIELMTPRRMLKNDLMLTDSEDESPVIGDVAAIVEIAENVEHIEISENVESFENTVDVENVVNAESEESSDGSFCESEDFSDSDAADFLNLL